MAEESEVVRRKIQNPKYKMQNAEWCHRVVRVLKIQNPKSKMQNAEWCHGAERGVHSAYSAECRIQNADLATTGSRCASGLPHTKRRTHVRGLAFCILAMHFARAVLHFAFYPFDSAGFWIFSLAFCTVVFAFFHHCSFFLRKKL